MTDLQHVIADRCRRFGADGVEIERLTRAVSSLDGLADWTTTALCAAIASGSLVPWWETSESSTAGETVTTVDLRHGGQSIAVLSVDYTGTVRGFADDGPKRGGVRS